MNRQKFFQSGLCERLLEVVAGEVLLDDMPEDFARIMIDGRGFCALEFIGDYTRETAVLTLWFFRSVRHDFVFALCFNNQ